MNRDMDLIRHLLLWVESDHKHELPKTVSREVVSYHAQLLIDAGFAEGVVALKSYRGQRTPGDFHIDRLTWSGHDFLDAARNDTIWRKAKDKIIATGSAWSFDVLKALLTHYAKANLGIP